MGHNASRSIRLHLIEALERRAASHEGEVRRLLDQKRASLLDNPDRDPAGGIREGAHVDPADGLPTPVRSGLGELAEHYTGHPAFPELPALEDFRKIWSALRAESQLRQTLDYVPENAGPLNSSALVHRSIELMREISPGYLRHFLAYVDDLSWMERISTVGAADKGAPQAASIGKRPRAKPRARR